MPAIDITPLRQGQRRALAKGITLIESKLAAHREQAQALLEAALPYTGNSLRLGITGIPGVGKSTFIEALGLHLIEQGKRVAVLAVDPTSPVTGGSILGDKTRMERLAQSEQAFIRPSPTSGSLGGVAQKTRESMLLCEAAGYDVIIVETVGVGQSEYEVASMVDFFLVLMLPNAGDELQGIKKGILELADAIVINKADGESLDMAKRTRQHYQNALRILHQQGFWNPPVLTCSALKHDNIEHIWQIISQYQNQALQTSELQAKRARQNQEWMWNLVHEMIEIRLYSSPETRQLKNKLQTAVGQGITTPFLAAQEITNTLLGKPS
jgi:LAO/AO transport system kinase